MVIVTAEDKTMAQAYMKRRLSEGRTIATLVLEKVDFSCGTFRLPVPEPLSQYAPLDFDSGNVRLKQGHAARTARLLKCFIRDPDCAVLMQELEASISDVLSYKWAAQFKLLAIPYNAEVYWRVSGAALAELSDDQMLDIMNIASYLPWTGFFYLGEIPLNKTRLDEADLEHVVANLVGIAVSAFDYRSFLIWWRDERRKFPTDLAQPA